MYSTATPEATRALQRLRVFSHTHILKTYECSFSVYGNNFPASILTSVSPSSHGTRLGGVTVIRRELGLSYHQDNQDGSQGVAPQQLENGDTIPFYQGGVKMKGYLKSKHSRHKRKRRWVPLSNYEELPTASAKHPVAEYSQNIKKKSQHKSQVFN